MSWLSSAFRSVWSSVTQAGKDAVKVYIQYPETPTPPVQKAGFDMNTLIPVGVVGIVIYLLIKK